MTAEQQPTDQTRRAPSRRTVAKGAAWAAPVLTGAALAPSIAASPTVCSTASQQTINNAMTLATQRSYPLEAEFFQPGGRVNGVLGRTWVNLNNRGPRILRATPANPIVLEIKISAVPGTFDPGQTRALDSPTTVSWGDIIRPTNLNVGGASPVTLTWRITRDIPAQTVGGTATDMSIGIGNRNSTFPRQPLVYLTARMTSFGVNDDLTAQDLPALSTLGLGAQQAPCTTYYQSQAALNTGPDKAKYTLMATGPSQAGPQAWPVGTTVDSRTLGNRSGGIFAIGEAIDGIW